MLRRNAPIKPAQAKVLADILTAHGYRVPRIKRKSRPISAARRRVLMKLLVKARAARARKHRKGRRK